MPTCQCSPKSVPAMARGCSSSQSPSFCSQPVEASRPRTRLLPPPGSSSSRAPALPPDCLHAADEANRHGTPSSGPGQPSLPRSSISEQLTPTPPSSKEAHSDSDAPPQTSSVAKMNTAFIATILTYSIHGSILLASLLVATMIARQQYKLSWLAALIKAMVTMASVKISTGMSLPKTMALKAFLALLITLGSLLGSSGISVAITRPGEDAEGNINVAHSMKLALTTFSADTNAYEYPKQAHKVFGIGRSKRSSAYPNIVFKAEAHKMVTARMETQNPAREKMPNYQIDTGMTTSMNDNATDYIPISLDLDNKTTYNNKVDFTEADKKEDMKNNISNMTAVINYENSENLTRDLTSLDNDSANATDSFTYSIDSDEMTATKDKIVFKEMNEMDTSTKEDEENATSTMIDDMSYDNSTDLTLDQTSMDDYIPTGLDKAGETTTEAKVVFKKATEMDASEKKDNMSNEPKIIFNMTEVTTARTYIKNHNNYKKKSISTVTALTFLSIFCGISFACGILQTCKNRNNNNTNQQIELNNI